MRWTREGGGVGKGREGAGGRCRLTSPETVTGDPSDSWVKVMTPATDESPLRTATACCCCECRMRDGIDGVIGEGGGAVVKMDDGAAAGVRIKVERETRRQPLLFVFCCR